MPNQKISELTAVVALTGAESVEVVQVGANKRTTLAQVVAAGSLPDTEGNDMLPLYSTVKQSAALSYGAL